MSKEEGINDKLMKKDFIKNGRLEEAKFWVTIMKEHSLFIKLGLPAEREALREEAQQFFDIFKYFEEELENATEICPGLLEDLKRAVSDLIEFKNKIIRLMVQCELQSSLLPLLVDHIRREAQRFLELLENPKMDSPLDVLLEREVFWLRIMKEHIEFIIHLLDPSERALINQAEEFRSKFSRMLETARDLKSMNEAQPDNFERVIRFTDNVIESTRNLRNFKARANELAVLCKILSIISSPLLLDHVRREADKFIEDVQELREVISELNS